MKRKVTVDEAFALITSRKQTLGSEILPLSQALGRRLADDLYAPIALPPFDNSAVDGYALGSLDSDFKVVTTIAAGDSFTGELGPSEACRIMTGAKLPRGTKAVVMQELVTLDHNQIRLQTAPRENDHVRWAGEDISSGALAASMGTRISAGHLGFFSALGISSLRVDRKPSIAIVSTGSELIDPGQPLLDGQVYYCTGPMLKAQCELAGAQVLSVQKIADDADQIIDALKKALAADIIITVGGMADGQYDFGRSTLAAIGVEPVFYEGQWRPGKPLFFGALAKKLVFGLPGNPVAAFVMFRIFVEAAIAKREPEFRYAPIIGAQPKASDKTQFLRARRTQAGLELLPGQWSHQLFNLALADSIVYVPPGEARPSYAYLPLLS